MKYLKILRDEEIQQHTEQTHSLWGEGSAIPVRLEKLKRRLASASPQSFFMSGMIDSQGCLIASLKRYYFPLRILGRRLNAIGLGAVFTHPDHRRKGYAAQLIQKVLEESKAEYRCKASLLYSDIDVRYYEKLGFVQVPSFAWSIGTSILPQANSLSTRPAEESDIPKLLEWYRRNVSLLPLSTDRTEESWKLFREIRGLEHDLILSDGKEDFGFLSLSSQRTQNHLWVEEWCAPLGAETSVWSTIRNFAQAEGYAQVKGWQLPYYRLNGAVLTPRTQAVPMVAALEEKLLLTSDDLASAYFASPDHF